MFPRWFMLVSASLALALSVAVSPARSIDPSSVRADGCHELFTFIDVPHEAEPLVRARVPQRFELYRTEYGSAQVAVTSRRCEHVTVAGGESRAMTEARLAVVIAAPPESEATCAACNWYLVFWVTDNQDFNAWLSKGPASPRRR